MGNAPQRVNDSHARMQPFYTQRVQSAHAFHHLYTCSTYFTYIGFYGVSYIYIYIGFKGFTHICVTPLYLYLHTCIYIYITSHYLCAHHACPPKLKCTTA